MDFFKMFIRYGIDKNAVAEILGKDVTTVDRLDDQDISRLIMDYVGKKS